MVVLEKERWWLLAGAEKIKSKLQLNKSLD